MSFLVGKANSIEHGFYIDGPIHRHKQAIYQ